MKIFLFNVFLFISFCFCFKWAVGMIWYYGFFNTKNAPELKIVFSVIATAVIFILFIISTIRALWNFFKNKNSTLKVGEKEII